MKLTFKKSNLVDATNIVLKAVSVKTTMPILTCILLEATDNEIKMTSNDMELAIETKVEGKISEPGSIAIDAKLFSEIIRRLPEGDVVLEEQDNNVTITCEKATFTLKGREVDDFVRMPEIETKDYICVTEFTLKEVIRQTLFSIAGNDNNKLMTGELFEISENKLKVVSLDGHRISIRNIKLRENYESRKVIVPGKTLSEISKIIPGSADKDVYIFFDNNYIIFEFGTTIVLSRVIEGEYFKVDKMISNDYEIKLSVNKKDFLDSIERSLLLVKETDKKPIVLKVNEEGMNISMSTDIGSMKEDIEIEKEGSDIMIGFNPRFLADALRVIDDETIDIYMMNAKDPCYIKEAEEKIINGDVLVNNEVDLRRGRKIVKNDIVEIDGEKIKVL